MSESHFPAGWDAERVKRLADYYDHLSDDEQAEEDEAAAAESEGLVNITVPVDLLPAIRQLLASHESR